MTVEKCGLLLLVRIDGSAISSAWIVLATASKTSSLDLTVGTCVWLKIFSLVLDSRLAEVGFPAW